MTSPYMPCCNDCSIFTIFTTMMLFIDQVIFWIEFHYINEGEPLYEMFSSEDQITSLGLFDRIVDQEMVLGPSVGFELQNSIGESELHLCKSIRKEVPKRSYEIENYV